MDKKKKLSYVIFAVMVLVCGAAYSLMPSKQSRIEEQLGTYISQQADANGQPAEAMRAHYGKYPKAITSYIDQCQDSLDMATDQWRQAIAQTIKENPAEGSVAIVEAAKTGDVATYANVYRHTQRLVQLKTQLTQAQHLQRELQASGALE